MRAARSPPLRAGKNTPERREYVQQRWGPTSDAHTGHRGVIRFCRLGCIVCPAPRCSRHASFGAARGGRIERTQPPARPLCEFEKEVLKDDFPQVCVIQKLPLHDRIEDERRHPAQPQRSQAQQKSELRS